MLRAGRRNSHARHAAADGLTVHRSDGARATAAVGPLADVDSGAAHGAMRPVDDAATCWKSHATCSGGAGMPGGELLDDLGGGGAGHGVALRTRDPPGPRGTVPVPASRRDRHGSAPDCGRLGCTLGPQRVSTTAFSGWRQAALAQRGVAKAPVWCVMMSVGRRHTGAGGPAGAVPGPGSPPGQARRGWDGRGVRVQDHPPV